MNEMKNIVKLTGETILASMVSAAICAGIAILQMKVLYSNQQVDVGEISTIVVIPTSAFIGPLSYLSFLRQWMNMKRFLQFTGVYFIVGFVLLFVLEIISGAAFWFIHFTAFLLLPLSYIVPEFISDDRIKH